MQAGVDGGRTYASEVTEHVPEFIPSGDLNMVGSSPASTLWVTSSSDPQAVYAYYWYVSNREKVVSSWHRINLGDPTGSTEVLYSHVSGSNVYLIMKHDGRVTYGKRSLKVSREPDMTDIADIHLDHLVDNTLCTFVYDPIMDETQVTLPYNMRNPQVIGRIATGELSSLDHLITQRFSVTPSLDANVAEFIHIQGNHTEFWVGEPFEMSLTLAEPFPRKYGPRGEIIPETGKALQLDNILLTLSATGFFDVTVERPTRPAKTHTYTGLGFTNNPYTIGGAAISDVPFKVPLKAPSDSTTISIASTSWLPFSLGAAEWVGHLYERRL
jgi:hypothetical protein